jgi:hypothetical protein
MRKYLISLFFITMLSSANSYATTWDEPWADKVIKEATSFILGKVISNNPEKGIKVFVLKTLGGKEVVDTILISNFYLLTICSSSGGHGAEFHTKPIDSCYFFINQNSKGQFSIATPTTGFDYVSDGHVMATFRHSYHQASVPVFVYEKTMTAIFNNYHNLTYDKAYIEKFVIENLSKSPAGFGEDEINTFFLQHVALECVYHLKLNIKETLVLPFLNDTNNFHNQVSAARAMNAFNTETNKQELLKAIGDTTKRNFVRVMCVWSLSDFNLKEFKAQLQHLELTASDERDGFGGNIMDPRVCTHIPTLKNALHKLVDKL